MAWHKALLRFPVALVVMYLASHSTADDACLWCDPKMSRVFLDCVYVDIQKSSSFGNLPLTSIDDMKNSILAAAGAMKKTPDHLKMSIMNGALAGELAELIKVQSVSQDPELLVRNLLGIVGNCYFEISGQSHHEFTGLVGSAVKSMMQGNAGSGGQLTSSSLSQSSQFPGGQNINLYNYDQSFRQQQTFAANQVAPQNYQGKPLNSFPLYPNAVQNYQTPPLANIQGNAQMYSINNQQNIPQNQNFDSGPYPINQQKRLLFYTPNTGIQPGISEVNLNNNQNGISNSASLLLQNNQQIANYDQNNQQIANYDQNNQQIANYNQNNQLYPIPNQNGPLKVMYPSNQASISTIRTDNSVATLGALNTAPQPNLKNNVPVVSKPPSPVITTDEPTSIEPQPNIQPNTAKKPRKPRRAKPPTPQVTPAPAPAPGTNVKDIKNRNDDDIQNAIKLAETIYFILSKSGIFTGIFNEDLSKTDAAPITLYIIQNALNECGYSKFSSDMANACVVSVTALPVGCASEIYAEAIAKTLMTQFYNIGLIGTNPVDQGSSLAVSILKQLQAILSGPSDSTTSVPSTDSSTDSITDTTSSSNDALVTTQDSNTPDSATTAINTQFYNALYDSLLKSLYFRTIFSKQATKSDIISWTVQMLTSLYPDYGKQITVAIARKCAKKLATLPDDCPLELFAEVICNCITHVLSNNGLISQVTPTDQAKSIASKCNTALIKIINKLTDDIPVDDSALQNTDNVPVDNLQPQNTANVPIVNSISQNIGNGQTIPQTAQNIPNPNKQPDTVVYGDNKNYPLGDKYITLQRNPPILKPINYITNANLNRGAQILKQNNDSPANMVVKDANINNNPAIEIFPDDDSDESRQRVQILMKWALSSIENGKFNYKIFSSVISALAKYLQTTHPELGAQKSLFKVLLESIIACTQLLTQAPASAFAIQNAPNTNGPNLMNTNVGDIKNANVPLTQNANVPLVQNTNEPLLQNVNTNAPNSQNVNNAPILRNANVPNPQNVNNAPILRNANVPNPQNVNNAPILRNANVPNSQNVNNAPILRNANVPNPQNVNNVPILQNTNVPNSQIVNNAPNLGNANVPILRNANVLNSQNVNNVPILRNANTPLNLPFPSPDMVQSNQNYPGAQQNNYNNRQQVNTDVFSTGLNNYAIQQDTQYNYNPPQQFDGNTPGHSFNLQQQTVTNRNDGYLTDLRNQNSFLPLQNNYDFQQRSVPGQGNFISNGQNNFPAFQAPSGIPNMNTNSNGASNNFQGGINDPSFFAGNPNQNAFPQNNMQGGYQN